MAEQGKEVRQSKSDTRALNARFIRHPQKPTGRHLLSRFRNQPWLVAVADQRGNTMDAIAFREPEPDRTPVVIRFVTSGFARHRPSAVCDVADNSTEPGLAILTGTKKKGIGTGQ